MATRKNIRDAIYSELTTAVASTSATGVWQDGSEGDEPAYPHVVYDEFPFGVSHNTGSAPAPIDVETNASGEVVDEIYATHDGLRYDVRVKGKSRDSDVSPIYNAIEDHFKAFNLWKSHEDIHADIEDLRFDPRSAPDESGEEDVTKVDMVAIEVEYEHHLSRYGTGTGDPITAVDHEVDADTDSSTSGPTYTTN